MIKKALLFILAMQAALLFSQPSTLVSPVFWLRADSTAPGAKQWRDVSGHGHHALPATGQLPAVYSRINFNPSFTLSQGEYFTVPSLLLTKNSITSIVVYQVEDSLREQPVWMLRLDTHQRVGLTSRSILGEQGSIHYAKENAPYPLINSLEQSWKGTPGNAVWLAEYLLGLGDSSSLEGKVAECLLFEGKLSDTAVVQYISYLAVKYGVTLYRTNYLDALGNITWNYDDYSDFSCSITGLGRDSLMGLHQRQSYMAHERMVIGVREYALTNEENSTSIPEGHFLLWGLDSSLLDQPQSLYWESGALLTVYGNGLLQCRGENVAEMSTFLHVDASGWREGGEGCLLLIDRSGEGDFLPLHTDIYEAVELDSNGMLYFNDILWDSDRNGLDRFCFAFPEEDSSITARNLSATGGGGDRGNDKGESNADQSDGSWEYGSGGHRYRLYPNPSPGDFRLQVRYSGAADVTVRIYSPEGKLLEEKQGKQSRDYDFDCSLRIKGQYMIEVNSHFERKSLKMIIQ